MNGLRERGRFVEIRRGRLTPENVRVRRVRECACDGRLDSRCDAEEALGRTFACDELAVALVDVAREERRGERVRARDEDGRNVENVGRETGRDERADELARGNEHLAAEVAALLLRGELILEVDACGPRLDERLHELECVERPAEAGLGIGDDGGEPVRAVAPLGRVDLVGAEERAVDPLDESRSTVGRIQALVGVRVSGEIRIGGDLPAGEVDGLETGLHHLDGLRARERTKGGDVFLRAQELPEPLCTEPRERVLDAEPPADALHIVPRVRPLHSGPAPVRLARMHLSTSRSIVCNLTRLDPK